MCFYNECVFDFFFFRLLITRYKFEPLLFNSLYYFCNLRSIWASSRVRVDSSSVEDQSHLSLGEPPTLQIALQVKLLPCAKAGSSGPRGEELAQSPRWEAGPAPQSPGWSLAPTPSPTGEPEKWVGRARSTHSHQVSLNRMGQITPKRLPTLNFWKIQSEEPYGTG